MSTSADIHAHVTATGADGPGAPAEDERRDGSRRWAVLAVVSAAQFVIILDLWVVNIALPVLQRDFAPATLSNVSWILDVYAIVLAALLLPGGRVADTIGRRAASWRASSSSASLRWDALLLLLAGIDRRPGTASGGGRGAATDLTGTRPGRVPGTPAGHGRRNLGRSRRGGRRQRPCHRRPARRVELAMDIPDQCAHRRGHVRGRCRDLAPAPAAADASGPAGASTRSGHCSCWPRSDWRARR